MKRTTKKGNVVKITSAGYMYVNGLKVSERKITPLYKPICDIEDAEIFGICQQWANRNYRMI